MPRYLTQASATGAAERGRDDVNRLRPQDRAIHDWYRFVLSFPPHLVRQYLTEFNIASGKCVLDPFCGTGTTVVECKKQGISSVGTETNPMAYLASDVKTDWAIDPAALLDYASMIAAAAEQSLEAQGLAPHADLPLFRGAARRNELRTISSIQEALLLKNSISPLPLHRALTLIDVMEAQPQPAFHKHAKLALASELAFSASNLRFGPEVGVGTQKEDAPVVRSWLNRVKTMCEDLELMAHLKPVPCKVLKSDARDLSAIVTPSSIDFVFTSPPYPNEKDYTRTTRLESVLLGLINDKRELRAVKRSLLRSNSRSVYKHDDDHLAAEQFASVQALAGEIERRRIEMGKTSGFERMYARVTMLYFGGMARHFAELKPVLKAGAHLAYVVGDQASFLQVHIKTGQILGEIAESLGYKVQRLDLFRTRLATATKQQLREEVLVLQWPG